MKFIELTLKDHIISYVFDARNREVTERIKVEHASKKMISCDKILSLSMFMIGISIKNMLP